MTNSERGLGNVLDRSTSSDTTAVVEVEELSEETLCDLFEKNRVACRQKRFCPEWVSAYAATQLLGHPGVAAYVTEPLFKRLGDSWYDVANDPSRRERYFANARPEMQQLRNLFFPFESPIDQLRCILGEIWPSGAQVAMLDGRMMKAGTARLCLSGDKADPHVDSIGFDSRAFKNVPAVVAQVSANIYLRMPEPGCGGELELWPQRLETDSQIEAYRLRSSPYALDRQMLGPGLPPIRPMVGELVIFDTSHPHAVVIIERGCRVTVAVFIGFNGFGKPLILWN